MAPIETNYFVCTLGEAAQEGIKRPYSDVNHLIRQQALHNPDSSAVGFFQISKSNGDLALRTRILTFKDVAQGVSETASLLSSKLNLSSGQVIALLADSSPEFLFTWLGCISLGHSVLLLAPQCSAAAIAHLCKVCKVGLLLADEKHESLANGACSVDADADSSHLRVSLLPFTDDEDVYKLIERDAPNGKSSATVTKHDVAYLHHTSGTSSGLPKPIPQTHHGAVGVLPALNGKAQATFTTTPLYHGGPADIFRAWTSDALIWLYPSRDIPVTAQNIVKCLDSVKKSSATSSTVKYFASVPYILQMMAEDAQGLKGLKQMDLVGVGGAALPADVGDYLVKEHVNLVSRFGSAECGFLLSSHRQYNKDSAWQFLRLAPNIGQLHFETREGSLAELVVGADWPHMAKHNREDGSYATSDLFMQHPSIENGWKYHSRADSQLTLVTGKKFDPAPTEDAISAASSNVSNVLIFGNGRSFPGALIFRSASAKAMTDAALINSVKEVVDKLNEDSQSHAKVTQDMLIPMPYKENALEKSSKGTVLRKQAEEVYATEIESSYQRQQAEIANVTDDQLLQVVMDIVRPFVSKDDTDVFTENSDLFAHGVDSIACVRIRYSLIPLLPGGTKLPLTVVEDYGSASALAAAILKIRQGNAVPQLDDQASQISGLIEKYVNLDSTRPVDSIMDDDTTEIETLGSTVLLTGPTGSLGAHVLLELLQSSEVSYVYLLVRGATQKAARERVLKAILARGLTLPENFDQKVTVLQCKLSDPDLGLAFQDYTALQDEVDVVLHLAWSVNFLLPLRSFTSHFAGIQNLLNLCLSSTKRKPARFAFCSSVASVSNFSKLSEQPANVPEQIIADALTSGSTGYALSKLTAELILARAATQSPSLRKRITVVRVGQLSADTEHGVWNASEAYPQILASAKFTDGHLPDLGLDEKLTWLPVDVAAKAFLQSCLVDPISMGDMPTEHVKHKLNEQEQYDRSLKLGDQGSSAQPEAQREIDISAVQVLHLLNPEDGPVFTEFVLALQRILSENAQGPAIKLVSASEWIGKLESLQQTDESELSNDSSSKVQSLLRLLPFWKNVYETRAPVSATHKTMNEKAGSTENLTFDMHNSLANMPALTHWLGLGTGEGNPFTNRAEVEHKCDDAPNKSTESQLLRSDYICKVWQWIQENVP